MFIKSAFAAAVLVLVSPRLFALGLGEIDMQSALSQPMQAVIELTSATSADIEDIKVSLASLQAHQRAGLSKASVLASFRFSVEKDSAGGAVVRISSTELIREPYLEFLLELEWPKGRLLRQYTVLVDPPVTMPATPVAPQAPVTPLGQLPFFIDCRSTGLRFRNCSVTDGNRADRCEVAFLLHGIFLLHDGVVAVHCSPLNAVSVLVDCTDIRQVFGIFRHFLDGKAQHIS